MTPSKTYRIVTSAVGIFLVVIAAWIIYLSYPPDFAEVLASLILLLLGVDALASAVCGKWSFLSRIGPLP